MRTAARLAMFAGLAMAASAPATINIRDDDIPDLHFGKPYHTNRRGKGQNNKRGKGARSKPKKRPNRLTISKRVRRKHRRAR